MGEGEGGGELGSFPLPFTLLDNVVYSALLLKNLLSNGVNPLPPREGRYLGLPINFSQDDVNAPDRRNYISDQTPLNHLGKSTKIEERGRSNSHP
jgi:hypothetical protein